MEEIDLDKIFLTEATRKLQLIQKLLLNKRLEDIEARLNKLEGEKNDK